MERKIFRKRDYGRSQCRRQPHTLFLFELGVRIRAILLIWSTNRDGSPRQSRRRAVAKGPLERGQEVGLQARDETPDFATAESPRARFILVRVVDRTLRTPSARIASSAIFPNQDAPPRGGFGSLIALPLQHGPRKGGNSVFLGHALAAIADDEQWTHLYSIRRINPLS